MEIKKVKVVRATVVKMEVELDRYIAVDGTVFERKYECEEYEDKLKYLERIAKFEKIESKTILPTWKGKDKTWGFKDWYKIYDTYQLSNLMRLFEDYGLFGGGLDDEYEYFYEDHLEPDYDMQYIKNKISKNGHVWLSLGVIDRINLSDGDYTQSGTSIYSFIFLDELMDNLSKVKEKAYPDKQDMYTILVNFDEYSEGIFETEKDAKDYMIKLIKKNFPDTKDLNDEETLEYDDSGYFRIMNIRKGD